VRNSAWFLVPEIVLIVGLSLARGETVETDVSWNPWWLRAVTQAPVTMALSKIYVVPQFDPAGYPPSGVLPAPPPAPVAVPSSGVLEAPLERQTITTTSVNADVLADKDPQFQRINFCAAIRGSAWRG
jgi:hypothetical protein